MDYFDIFFGDLFGELTHSPVDHRSNPDEGILVMICLAMGIDGEIADEEREVVFSIARQLYTFEPYDDDELVERIDDALDYIDRHSVDIAIELALDELAALEDRERAFQFVAYVERADGVVTEAESELLDQLVGRLQLSDDRAAELLEELEAEIADRRADASSR
jgi:uncharacterized tellurite resistance protein B-like protein